MNRILFLSSLNVDTPKNKGTPLRVTALFRIMREKWGLRIQPIDLSEHRKGSWMRALWVKRRDFDIAFCNTHGCIPPMLFCKLILRKKTAIDIHGSLEEERYFRREIGYVRKTLLRYFYRSTIGLSDLVCLVSEFGKKQLPSWIQNKAIVVYPGLESLPESTADVIRHEPPEAQFPIKIGYIGNSQPYQGIDTLLRIAKRLNEKEHLIKLVIGSSDKARFTAMLEKEYPERPTWLELHFDLSHFEATALLQTIDILPLLRPITPLTNESFPAKIPEYLASGKTCIFSKFSDLPNLLQDGKDAYFIHSGSSDVDEGCRLIEEILERKRPLLDPQHVKSMAERTFSWQVTTGELIQKIEQL